jgi:hypothetical protein
MMLSRCFRRAVVLTAALALSACTAAGNQSGTKMIDGKVWGWYQEYQRAIAPSNPGAFAVSMDGSSAYYFYCQEIQCLSGGSYKREALKGCRNLANQDCYIFGFKNSIEVSYKIRN